VIVPLLPFGPQALVPQDLLRGPAADRTPFLSFRFLFVFFSCFLVRHPSPYLIFFNPPVSNIMCFPFGQLRPFPRLCGPYICLLFPLVPFLSFLYFRINLGNARYVLPWFEPAPKPPHVSFFLNFGPRWRWPIVTFFFFSCQYAGWRVQKHFDMSGGEIFSLFLLFFPDHFVDVCLIFFLPPHLLL